MTKVKIAQIGTSTYSHGNDIFNCLKRNSDIFEIVGYHFPENEREKFPERMADFDGFKELSLEEILNDPEIEAVTVETEEIYLTKYAQMAADHKKHIQMEKPGGMILSDFEKLIDTVKRNNTVFQTGYMYRYNPLIMELIKNIKNGELGDIISVEAQMGCHHNEKLRQWLDCLPGGMMFYLGCHLIDLIFTIQGKPKNIIPLSCCSGIGGITSDDFGMAVLEYENGVSFAKTSAVEIGGFDRRHLVVSGTKKTVEIKPLELYTDGGLCSCKTTIDPENRDEKDKIVRSEFYDRYDNMIRSFAQLVRGEKENSRSYDYELELYKIILEACGVKNQYKTSTF